MIQCQIYNFKQEFCKELNIPANQANRRQEELLAWLANFYDYDFLKGNPLRIHIKEIYGEYQPMPRKVPSQEERSQEKKNDYEAYTIAALGTEFKPNSKMKIAREAIKDFGREKYYHTNHKAVAERYIKEPFEKYGETDDIQKWVYYSTYSPLSNEEVEDWRNMLRDVHLDTDEAANAFYRHAQGEDVSKEIEFFKMARDKFIAKYGDFPVLVKSWKVKERE